MMETKKITTLDLFRIFMRCFLVQGSWNFKNLLGMGFCFSAIPIAKRLYTTKEEQHEFILRHLDFFNAHPYYASWCLGAVANLEEEAQKAGWRSKHPISIFKERVVGPLGSIGDQFFWNGIKPLMAGFGVLMALLIGWQAALFFLVLYNMPHIYIRLIGFIKGYKKGFDIIDDLAYERYKKSLIIISMLGALVAGGFLVIAGKWSFDQDPNFLIVFLISIITVIIFMDIRKPVWMGVLFSVFFSIVVQIIVYFTS